MPSDADIVYLGKQSVAEDDEIIAGEQKMSLKCPVRPIDADPKRGSLNPLARIVELCPDQPSHQVEEMRPSTMLRCNVMVQHDGADDDVALPHL